MRAVSSLPPDYREIYSIDLQKDKKTAIFVNVLALLLAAAMALPANHFIPLPSLFHPENGFLDAFLKIFVFLFSMVAYLFLHELVHGITMKAYGTKKVHYGFTGMFAFAGSADYYDKKSYCTIALAPILVFLFVFAAIQAIVPREWFWVVYLLQVCNVSGAAGDLFVTVKFAKMPRDILIKDSGVGMTVYSSQSAQ